MRTIQSSPGSIGFSKGSDRSGHHRAGFADKIGLKVLANCVVRVLNGFAERQKQRDQYLELMAIDERTLRDIGITRDQANDEARRISRSFKIWL